MAKTIKRKKAARTELSFYEKALPIDRHNLDEEVIRQADLFYAVSKQCSGSEKQAAIARDLYYSVKAECAARVRKELEKQNNRVTKEMVDTALGADPENIEARKVYDEKKHNVTEWQALREAVLQRSFMLKELVQLYVAGYFIESKAENGSRNQRS